MKLIEFVGMPRSGKTTQAELLKKELETRGKKVMMLSDRERMASLSTPPQESLAFALAFYGQLLDAYYRYEGQAEVMIVDRGFSDVAVWADVYKEMKTVTDEEAAALAACYERFARLATAVVCMTVTPEISLARHSETLHEEVDSVAMNPEWLSALSRAYAARTKEFSNVAEVEGTSVPEAAHVRIMAFLEETGSL